MEINKQSPYKQINISDKNAVENALANGINGKVKRGGMFKKRLQGENGSTPKGSAQDRKHSQVSRLPNGSQTLNKSSKLSGQLTGLNGHGSGGSTSGFTGLKNKM